MIALLRAAGILVAALDLLALVPKADAAPSARTAVVIRVDPRRGEAGAKGAQTVATLQEALDRVAAIRTNDPTRPLTIALSPGTFRLDQMIRIGPEHGGTPEAPLVIRGAPGGATRLVGAAELAPLKTALDPGILARLPPEARSHARAYRLPEAALEGQRFQAPRLLSSPPVPVALEVFDETGPLEPARWPNQGWAHVATGSGPAAEPAFTIDEARLDRWRQEPDLWAEGYWRWNWLFESLPVVGLDPARRRLRLASLPYEGILAGARFRIAHALSELDQPGEWWRDTARGLLIAWPRPGHETLDVAFVNTLLSVEGASHLRIEDLRLEETRGDLLTIRGGRDVVVRNVAIARAAGRAAVIEGAEASGLDHCDIADIGRAGVRLQGGDRVGLVPAGLFVRDSRFTRYATLSTTQNPAVEVDGVGTEVSGNYFHDAGGSAIALRGNDHRVVRNEIARVLLGASDNGAIYAGRDWTARGTLIQGNFIHDVRAEPGFDVKGVYLDDMASGFAVRRNLFLRVDQAVFIGGGRDNLVDDNVFVASNPAIHVDSRGQTWAVKSATDPGSELRRAYAAMPVDSPLWRERYPGLAGLLADAPQVAKNNSLIGNIFLASQPFRFNDGGSEANQNLAGNIGPEGVRLSVGQDAAALAAGSERPKDFATLTGPDGAPLPPLDVSAMRRSALPTGAFAARSR